MTEATEIAFLARLLTTGICRESSRFKSLINRYEIAGWIMPGNRRGEWVLRSSSLSDIEHRLNTLLPTWNEDFDLLKSLGRNPMEPNDIEALPAFKRNITATGIVNRRNWKAISGLGPKHTAHKPTEATLTHDWVLRFRPNSGLKAKTESGLISLSEVAEQWTECVMPERGWLKIIEFVGVFPIVIVTCENLGAYIGLPLHKDMLVVYAPGKDIGPAVNLLKKLPTSKWLHFGDLDPEGFSIAQQISFAADRELVLFVPSFADEYLDLAKKPKTQWASIPTVPILQELKKRGKGIFQEVFMLDDRLGDELANVCQDILLENK